MDYYINLVYSICVFISGLLFGSFFTLATYRIPRHQDIVKTRSYCPNCKHKLGFFDCFPVLSYVSTIGRCKYCREPISIRYPLIELASGFTFLIIYLIFGFSFESLILIIAYITLFLIIGVDIMKSKMTEEEKEEVNNLKKAKESKKGAINVDIIVAIILFSIFFVSNIFITRNYNSTLIDYSLKADALNLCLNKINEEKTKSINELTSNSDTVNIDGVSYTYRVNVIDYLKQGNILVPNAKIIDVNVSYILSGNEQNVNLKYLKVESE